MQNSRLLIPFALCALPSIGSAAVTPIDSLSSYDNGTGTGWTGIGYSDPSLADPGTDQQTGGLEGDLVGNAIVPFFYTAFDTGSAIDSRDGTISFRTRHGGDSNPAGFEGAVSIGIDANGDGQIDGFVGINNSGSADAIYFWNADNGVSSDNTSISSLKFGTIHTTITEVVGDNYNYRNVVEADLGAGVSLDIDGDAGAKALIDTYLSFSVDFGDLVTFLEQGITGETNPAPFLTDQSAFRYIVGTSKQGNNFNQDTGGIDGTTGEGILFSDPNAPISTAYTPTGTVAVPEPSSTALLFGATSLLLFRRKRA